MGELTLRRMDKDRFHLVDENDSVVGFVKKFKTKKRFYWWWDLTEGHVASRGHRRKSNWSDALTHMIRSHCENRGVCRSKLNVVIGW